MAISCITQCFNSLRPRQNGRYNADDIFQCIFLKENVWIPTKISLRFVLKGPINNIPALVQIMAWRRPGDKPLSQPMMVSLLTHICVTRPQWVNLGDTAMRSVRYMYIFWPLVPSRGIYSHYYYYFDPGVILVHSWFIAWTATVSHRTAVPHSSYHLLGMFEWSLSLHSCVCIKTLRPSKMVIISQTTLANAFSWMKMLKFPLIFHWSLFLRVQLVIFQHWFR